MTSNKITDKNNILENLQQRDEVIIELGCGKHKEIPASIGIDIIDSQHVDIVADLNSGLGFLEDNSVDVIHSSHVLEHLEDLGYIMSEIYRVLKPGGINKGLVPHFSNPYYYSDYTHKTPFGLYTFSYFSKQDKFRRKVLTYYNKLDFRIKKIKILFYSPFKFINIFRKIYTLIFNSSMLMQEFYEGSLSNILSAHEIYFELEKGK